MNNDYIELLIKVPKEIYKHTQEYEVGGFNTENGDKLFMVIKNGTPLPKGHGRIGDLDGVEKIVCDEFVDLQDGSEEWRNAVNDAVENILHRVHDLPTIFEADKEGAEK